jgi:hypothetical protein
MSLNNIRHAWRYLLSFHLRIPLLIMEIQKLAFSLDIFIASAPKIHTFVACLVLAGVTSLLGVWRKGIPLAKTGACVAGAAAAYGKLVKLVVCWALCREAVVQHSV